MVIYGPTVLREPEVGKHSCNNLFHLSFLVYSSSYSLLNPQFSEFVSLNSVNCKFISPLQQSQCSHDLEWNLSNLNYYSQKKSCLKYVLINSGTKLTNSWPCPRLREQNLLPPNPERSASFTRSPIASDAGLVMNTTGMVGLLCSNMASKLENKIIFLKIFCTECMCSMYKDKLQNCSLNQFE